MNELISVNDFIVQRYKAECGTKSSEVMLNKQKQLLLPSGSKIEKEYEQILASIKIQDNYYVLGNEKSRYPMNNCAPAETEFSKKAFLSCLKNKNSLSLIRWKIQNKWLLPFKNNLLLGLLLVATYFIIDVLFLNNQTDIIFKSFMAMSLGIFLPTAYRALVDTDWNPLKKPIEPFIHSLIQDQSRQDQPKKVNNEEKFQELSQKLKDAVAEIETLKQDKCELNRQLDEVKKTLSTYDVSEEDFQSWLNSGKERFHNIFIVYAILEQYILVKTNLTQTELIYALNDTLSKLFKSPGSRPIGTSQKSIENYFTARNKFLKKLADNQKFPTLNKKEISNAFENSITNSRV